MVVLGFVGRMDDVESFLPPRNGRREMQRKIALAPSFGFFLPLPCLAFFSTSSSSSSGSKKDLARTFLTA